MNSSIFLEEQVIAKSTIVLDVKPWDDETDLQAMEKSVRSIEADGLIWGQCKFTRLTCVAFAFDFDSILKFLMYS